MGKNYLKLISFFMLAALLVTGCKKALEETNAETDLQSANRKPKNECRLTNVTHPTGEYNYHYNDRGLCDEFDISDYGTFRQEYDANKKLKISKLYVGADLINTIHFLYQNGRVVKEVWYDGNTTDIIDEVIYTYNSRGQMVRGESFMLDYYTITTWTHDGNTASWKFFIGGNPFYAGYLKFTRPVKNPYLAIPGIEYGFPFVNPTYFINKWWSAAEKVIIYDENGAPIVLYDQDPSQTVWQIGHQNYPLSTNHFDMLGQIWMPFTFEYENCEPGGHHQDDDSRVTNPLSSRAIGKINSMMLLKHHPSKSMKEQMREIREQLKK